MRRLELTVVQLEEAKRFIQTDRIPYLRLALLLLDNAAEVLMHRAIQDELTYSEWYSQMAASLRSIPQEEAEKRRLLSESEPKIILGKRQQSFDRYFNEKVNFLSQERQHISMPVARVLKHIHDYRNEAYHNDRVRPDSIRPAVLILFDVACTLLATLPLHSTTWHGGDSEAWLERYGFSRYHYAANDIQTSISDALRVDLPLEVEGVRAALTAHLRSRLDGIEESIDFIIDNAQPDRSREEVLKAVQYWNADRSRTPWSFGEQSLSQFPPRYTPASIEEWRREVSALEGVADKLELFNWFADIEDEFEPLEGLLNEVAGLIDSALQAEMDRMGGK
jgi:hypothetical protein